VSRASEIAEIDEMLSGERRCERVAIVGLGGVGKTQIALEYVHSLREQQPDCAVFWIPVTSVESMLEAYLEIGQQLQIPDLGEGKAGIRSLVQQRLSQESSGKWLLVFDNADDTSIWTDKPEDTAGSGRQAAYLPRSKHGSILFTTRSHKTAVDLAGRNVVKVKQMNNTLAKNLLGKCLINRSLLNDEPATTDMLQKLTNLPLAIVQAAAFINRNQMTLREYISLLDDTEQSMVDILSQDFEDEGRYEEGKNPIATTWLISFEQIRSCDPLAAEFLSLMACVDSKNIPQLFLQPTQSTMQAADAIGTLKAFSFITKHENGQLLDLHRLVHLATRNWLRMEGTLTAWTIKTVDRLNELFPFPGDENRDLWRLYLPHARYALDSAAEDSTSSAKIHLLYIFGICAVKDGRYDEAEKALAKVTQNRRIWLGTEHPLTLDSETFLVLAYLHQGQWKKAEELGIQVLGTQEKVLGSEHLCTLASTSTLVTIYIRQERWLEAEKLELQAIKGYEKVFGADHPDTWSCKAALASIYHQKGKWNQCRKLYVQIMKGHRRAYGMEHPRTLSSTNNVAYIYTRLKLLRKAEALQAQALETSKKVLGEEHPHTLAATSNLASIYYLRRRFKDAEKLQIQVLKCHQKLFGAEHPDIPPLMVELAGTWNKLGRVSDAIELLEKCTQLERKVWVADYPETLPYVLRHERRLKRWQVYRRMVGGSTST
jgi:tetratricopeptide (TPR) repeat protein